MAKPRLRMRRGRDVKLTPNMRVSSLGSCDPGYPPGPDWPLADEQPGDGPAYSELTFPPRAQLRLAVDLRLIAWMHFYLWIVASSATTRASSGTCRR